MQHARVYARIDLGAVEENFRNMKANLAEGVRMIGVVKTDGYGHGAVRIALKIQDYDYLWGFAVATVEEAMELREAGIAPDLMRLSIGLEDPRDIITDLDRSINEALR